MDIEEIAERVSGKLMGSGGEFRGKFTTLGAAEEGDIVIRHWIDDRGIQIASERGVAAIITQDLRSDTSKRDVPIVLVDRIEIANALALSWTINRFASSSRRIAVTGTNGKSTTTHMINHIITTAGRSSYTNTDSRSEFNTLIDPVVAQQIAEAASKEQLEFMVIEVSEVQGWLGRVMVDHAHIMTSAIQPEMVVITNVAMDHIGLVESVDDVFREVSGALRAVNSGVAVLNSDDERVRAMADVNPLLRTVFYGSQGTVRYSGDGIYCGDDLVIQTDELPFTGEHFIQNTLAAVTAALELGFSYEDVRIGVKTYRPLKRRFTLLMDNPRVIDDFAHNPDGIRATVKSAASGLKGRLWVVNAIRGSRGEDINIMNAEALADSVKGLDVELVITSSSDLVDEQNRVLENERRVFLGVLDENGIGYTHIENLRDALRKVLESAKPNDTVLLLGAQGMDPASEVIEDLTRKILN
ncbi:Mur ligase family protein [Methanothermobacter sp.]|uniref:Mur ligase family protein n=1 Tax=Methanothermobacter sp. TaxID=1884223 RepID=UPI0026395811|nr:Mur ligase family protein [Methanothermobacter sp.]MDI9618318.1 Mur ligase family protein [Methanothermobacter sp.]